jgi:hypothetical protein
MRFNVILLALLIVVDFIYSCTHLRNNDLVHPKKIRIAETDIQEYKSDDDFKNIRIHVDWSNFDPNVPETNKEFAKALKDSIIPRTVNIFQKLIKVRRLVKPLKFRNLSRCDMYTVPEYLRKDGVEADLVIFPIIEKTGLFIKERAEAAALYCAQSGYDGRPLMGFIEYRPNLLAGDAYHIDYHIWLSIHELTHVFVFNDSLWHSFIDPKTNKKLGIKNVMKAMTVNGNKMNFVVTKRVRELAAKHFNCPNAIGVPLENKGSPGTRDGHWNRKAMNGDYMIGKSFGENLISDMTLALFEDSGWYKVNYDLSNAFIWGKNKGCDFLYCKDCYSKKKIDLKKGIFKIKSKYPNEFCANFNNPVCSTHNMFRGYCMTHEDVVFDHTQVKVMPFTDKNVGGSDVYMDYCPSAQEVKDSQLYYGGSCRLGANTNLLSHEKICPNCTCVVANLNPKKIDKVAKSKKKKIKMGNVRMSYEGKFYFKKAPHMKASCMEYKCVENELYINILDKHYHCTKRYLEIEDFGTIKCPLKALICHPKYNCKFGCVERYE